jgi:hypothetical protein
VDDDCDSSADEGYAPDASCFLPGACAAGNQASSCVGGVETACQTGTPTGISESVCNGVDDDCDGFTDEDYVVPEVATDLRFVSDSEMAWSATAGVPRYNAYRGNFGGAPWAYDHTCFQSNLVEPRVADTSVPGTGWGFYYLISASTDCGEGGLGSGRGVGERPNPAPCQ